MDPLAQLQAHVRQSLGSRVQYAGAWRVDELTRLVVVYWPHYHLEAAEQAGGRLHKAVDHAMLLCRAQVRERWEAAHGVGPLWQMVLAGTVSGIWHTLLPLWWADAGWRDRLRQMGGRVD